VDRLTGSAYFSTMLGKFTKDPRAPPGVYNQSGGIWNITHSNVLDPFYSGRPGEFKRQTGLTWIQVRKIMKNVFLSTTADPYVKKIIQYKILDLIPIRSGRLADTIFKSMRFWRGSYYSTHYISLLTYHWSVYRPRPIPGQTKHSPPEKGYGEWATYRVISPLVRSRVTVDHVTPYGNALYILNDPLSLNDPEPVIDEIMSDMLEDEFAERFNIVLELVL